VFCPQTEGFEVAVGSDFLLSGGANINFLFVNRFLLTPGYGLTHGGDAHFFVANFNPIAAEIKPIVGCVLTPVPAGRTGKRSRLAVRVSEPRLKPSRRATYIRRCLPGERLLRAVPGVLFHTRNPPSVREVSQVSVVTHVSHNGARFVVRTSPEVGDNERVTVQLIAVCKR
jgi:hypothetical protein